MEITKSKASPLRALLTEVLPYELPVEMTTHWFYDWFDSNLHTSNHNKAIVVPKTRMDILIISFIQKSRGKYPNRIDPNNLKNIDLRHDFLVQSRYAPMEFSVRRDKSRKRDISLLGLASQLSISFVYASHKDALIYYSTRDRSSLRHPSRINSEGKNLRSHRRNRLLGDAVTVETVGRRLGTYNSYFVYENYAFVGQFYDSNRWHALEAHWTHLRRLDVAGCFKSIYTHSFAWSTGTDYYSKNHISKSNGFKEFDLGRSFDKSMQASNWGETNGIPIGPESSRIFAEIIFQKIDSEIHSQLAAQGNNGFHYEFLRYVDDYFIFSNDEAKIEIVSATIEEVLSRHGYTINSSKTMNYTTPFTTSISSKKAVLKGFLKQALPYKGKLPEIDAREINVNLKALLIDSANDSATVGTSLSHIERRLRKFIIKRSLKCRDFKSAMKLVDYSWTFVHNALYQYLTHPSVASSMKVVRMLRSHYSLSDLFELSTEEIDILKFKVSENCHFAISRAIKRLLDIDGSEIEICHFLSLATACRINLSSADMIIDRVANRVAEQLTLGVNSRGNFGNLFLLLSTIKFSGLSSTAQGGSGEIPKALLNVLNSYSQATLSTGFIPKRYIRSHAAQELLVLAVVSCPYISVPDKLQVLEQDWLKSFLTESIKDLDDWKKDHEPFLRSVFNDCAVQGSAVSIFSWTDEGFDGVLYEKEPQFIY